MTPPAGPGLMIISSEFLVPRKPPTKQKDTRRGRRKIEGEILDVAAGSGLLGITQKSLRARVARREVPFRRFVSRIVFLRSELMQFLVELPGLSLEELRAGRKSK
jgi:hypothetical protein